MEERRKMYVVIVGGGKVGYYLIKTLMERNHHVAIIEKDPIKCQMISEETGILTIQGDGTDLAALADAGIDNADVVAAVTGMDETNLVICQLAKIKFQVKKVVARVNNPKNRDIIHKIGIDIAVSGTSLIADAIEGEILHQEMKIIAHLAKNKLSVIQVQIPKKAKVIGMKVYQLKNLLPNQCILTAIITPEERIEIPKGDTEIKANTTIIALVGHGQEETLQAFFHEMK